MGIERSAAVAKKGERVVVRKERREERVSDGNVIIMN